MNRSANTAIVAVLFLLAFSTWPVRSAAPHMPLCFGRLRVSPAQTAPGGTVTLTGSGYTCSSPAGFLSAATIMLYQPRYGFAMFQVHPHRDGTYRQQISMPQKLLAVSDIRGGGRRMLPTRPGRYFLGMTLFDVSLPPSSGALAHLTLLQGTAPSAAQISAVMARTVEVNSPTTHFVPTGSPLTIADGRGAGVLTAVVGTRYPTADAAGQLTFFWFNRYFLGWDSPFETTRILSLSSPAPGAFTIAYAHYAARDPLCCPSLRPVVVHSGWSGTMLISDGAPPLMGRVKVRLLPGR